MHHTPIPDVDDNISSDASTKNSEKKREELRGGGRGKKVAQLERLKEDKATRKRSRDEEKERTLDVIMAEMTEIKKLIKKKSAVTIITKALKETDYDEIKKKLKAKLVQIALDLE